MNNDYRFSVTRCRRQDALITLPEFFIGLTLLISEASNEKKGGIAT
jgi:hypothetical protein